MEKQGSQGRLLGTMGEALLIAAGFACSSYGVRLLVFTESHVAGWMLVVAGLFFWVLEPTRKVLEARRQRGRLSRRELTPVEGTDAKIVQIAIPRRLLRLLQFRPFGLLAGTLVAGSITASPMLLFKFGQEKASILDWRVIACFAVTFFVPLVYVKLGSLVMHAVPEEPVDAPAASAPASRP